MAELKVPELSRKIQLLLDAGFYPNRTAFAAALDRRPATIRGWINGSSGPDPETVPQQNAGAFIALFAKALPDLTDSHVQDLLEGPASDLECHLFPKGRGSFVAFIEVEAIKGQASIILKEKGLGLIRLVRKTEPDPEHRITLGQAFRVEFSLGVKGNYALGLQGAPAGWGLVPSTVGPKGKTVHLPGMVDGSDPDFMAEDNEVGRHQFIVMISPQAFPPDIRKAGLDGLPLDRTLLDHLLRFYRRQEVSRRALYSVDVEITVP